ncbi:MAG: RloB domain-containing protein [Bacteroidales bacterium]|nr:RloB domain-containing protein [Bacteroidales bacterium]
MARQTSIQKSRKPIPVIIGAGITEQWYFTHLQGILNLTVRIRPRYFGTEDIHKLDKKIAQVINDGATAICVFDTDTTQYDDAEKKKLFALKKKYEGKKNVILCDSLPSIEYWFLLHYEDTNRHFANYKAVANALEKYIPEYEKKEGFLSKRKWVEDMVAENKLENAVKRSVKYDNKEGSYSKVYKAIEALSK